MGALKIAREWSHDVVLSVASPWHSPRTRARDEGQMIAELAVVAPVFIVVLAIMMNTMIFVSECARFDSVASQVIVASAGGYPNDDATIQSRLSDCLGSKSGFRYSVKSTNPTGGYLVGYSTVTATLTYQTWPGLDFSWAGIDLDTTMTHKKQVYIDKFLPGVLF